MKTAGDRKTAEVDLTAEGSRPLDVLIALAPPTRRAIFEHLTRHKEGAVASLAARFGITRQAVLKHLGILEHAGLVTCSLGTGHTYLYRARPLGVVPLIGWLVGWLEAGAGHYEAESERLIKEAIESPPQKGKYAPQARHRERKLAKRLATMSPEERRLFWPSMSAARDHGQKGAQTLLCSLSALRLDARAP